MQHSLNYYKHDNGTPHCEWEVEGHDQEHLMTGLIHMPLLYKLNAPADSQEFISENLS